MLTYDFTPQAATRVLIDSPGTSRRGFARCPFRPDVPRFFLGEEQRKKVERSGRRGE